VFEWMRRCGGCGACGLCVLMRHVRAVCVDAAWVGYVCVDAALQLTRRYVQM